MLDTLVGARELEMNEKKKKKSLLLKSFFHQEKTDNTQVNKETHIFRWWWCYENNKMGH